MVPLCARACTAAYLTTLFLRHFPVQAEVGRMEYVLLPSTAERLKRIATTTLGLRHRGHHNVGPTWYADAATVVAIANLSIPIMHHIYAREFEQAPGGAGLIQRWQQGARSFCAGCSMNA